MSTAASEALGNIMKASTERLRDLCAISSESGNADGLKRLADRLAADLERFGFRSEIVESKGADGKLQPTLIARGPGTEGAHVLLMGHLDTVLPAVEPRVEGRRLFATGALDMKGGLAMFVGALELMASRGGKLPDDLILVAVPDEEAEGVISVEAMNHWSRGARAVLVLEPGKPLERGETLVAGRRGLTEWSLEVSGRSSHSGLAYWTGRSALAAAADWCARAQALSRPGTGPTVNVSRLVGGSADFVDELGRQHAMFGTARQLNVIPDRARAEGEFRFLSVADGDEARQELEALSKSVAAAHEVTMTFRLGETIAPVDPNGPGAPLAQRALELAAARGFALEIEEDRGGVSFPNFLASPGEIPVVDGLGPTGEGMHVQGEYLDLDSLERRIVLLADLLATL
jgi:glutamate carboxypeptidase